MATIIRLFTWLILQSTVYVASVGHNINLVRFDVALNRTVQSSINIALDVNANEVAVEACYELFYDASKEEVNHCVAMATLTIRDHTLALSNAAIESWLGKPIQRFKASEVTTMALQYAFEDITSYHERGQTRLCFIGMPSLLDSLYMFMSGVDELLILNDVTEEQHSDRKLQDKKELEQLAGYLNKKVIVLFGKPMDTLQKLHNLQRGDRRLCQALVVRATLLDHMEYVDEALSIFFQFEQSISFEGAENFIIRANPISTENSNILKHSSLRVVVVRDFNMRPKLLQFPLTYVHGRHFVSHNTTKAMFGVPQTRMNVDWLLGSVWVNVSSMYAQSNVDGMTGRTFSSPNTLSEHDQEAGILAMQEVWVGEITDRRDALLPHTTSEPVVPTAGSVNVVIAISYTIRVFGETALGLKNALRSLGYHKVYIVPDMNLVTLKHLRSEADQQVEGCSNGLVLQIVLGPHDFTMLLPRYIVFQMEQVWSTIAFSGLYKQRYGLVLSNALCILTYSPLHSELLHSLGYPCVYEVPLYSHTPIAAKIMGQLEHGVEMTPDSDIHDFSFYGGCSGRRQRELNKIRQAFPLCDLYNASQSNNNENAGRACYRYVLNCVGWGNGVFDSLRYLQVQRSRLLVNIHTDEQSVLEAHRLNYLLSQGACVVSETSDDALLDAKYAAAVRLVPAGDHVALHNTIRALLDNSSTLERCRQASIDLYRSLSADTDQLNTALQKAIENALNK